MSRSWRMRAAILLLLLGVSVLLLLPALRHEDHDACVSCASPVSRFVDRLLHASIRRGARMPKPGSGSGELHAVPEGPGAARF